MNCPFMLFSALPVRTKHFVLPVCAFLSAVHPDNHPDHLHEPQCLSSTGHALHAQGVHHYLPPRDERTEEEA